MLCPLVKNNEKSIKVFIRFLKEEKIYTHYKQSLYKEIAMGTRYSSFISKRYTHPYNFFSQAFTWSKYFGMTFWINYSLKWTTFYNNFKCELKFNQI